MYLNIQVQFIIKKYNIFIIALYVNVSVYPLSPPWSLFFAFLHTLLEIILVIFINSGFRSEDN